MGEIVSVQGRRSLDREPVILTFAGELDAGDSGLGDELRAAINGGATTVIVDLLNVVFIDSSVIRALVLAHREVSAEEGWLRVVYTHHLVRRVIDMCGLAEIFPQYVTIEAAWREIPSPPPSSESLDNSGLPS